MIENPFSLFPSKTLQNTFQFWILKCVSSCSLSFMIIHEESLGLDSWLDERSSMRVSPLALGNCDGPFFFVVSVLD